MVGFEDEARGEEVAVDVEGGDWFGSLGRCGRRGRGEIDLHGMGTGLNTDSLENESIFPKLLPLHARLNFSPKH